MKKLNPTFSILTLLLFCHTQCKTTLKNNTNISIPEGFEIIDHNKNSDEILALNFKNEMRIIISKNLSNIIKKGEFFGYGVMKMSMKAKYLNLIKQHHGTNSSEINKLSIGNNIYLYQNFDYDISDTKGYYEYGGLYIENPEDYYEFFISGSKLKQESHKEIIKSLLNGVK